MRRLDHDFPLTTILLASCVLLGPRSQAAEIRYGPPDQDVFDALQEQTAGAKRSWKLPGKLITLSGEIEPGDADKLRAIIGVTPQLKEYREQRIALLRLDSPGGSFKEGIAIARLVDQWQIPTFIQRGAECLSACAVIFMAGTEQIGEGAEFRSRTIEVPAKLGFHRPFIGEMQTDIPPSLIAELSAEDLGALFSEQYQLSFDIANELIQEMLSVDPDAWSTELLLRMLTATNREETGRFVYLDTVNDALDWGIEVLNIAPAPAQTPEERFKMAFWLCFNGASRVSFYYKAFWPHIRHVVASAGPDTDGLYDMLAGNLVLMKQRNTVAGPGSLPYAAEGERVYNVGFGPELTSGCFVRFSQDWTTAEVEFKPDTGLREFFNLDEPRDAIYTYDALQRLEDTRLTNERTVHGDRPNIATGSLREPELGRCFVYKSRRKIDDEACFKLIEYKPNGDAVDIYVWPSGSRTVVVRGKSGVSLNGKPTTLTGVVGETHELCLVSSETGNTFCFDRR